MAKLDRQRLLRLIPYLGRDRRRLLLTLTLLVPVAAAAAIQPLLVGQAISALRHEPVMPWLARRARRPSVMAVVWSGTALSGVGAVGRVRIVPHADPSR